MQTEQKKHEAYSTLLAQKNRWGQYASVLLAGAAVLWAVAFLVNLELIRELKLMQAIDAWLDDHGLLRALLNLLRYGTAAAALWTAGMYVKYFYLCLVRRNIGGESAPLDETVGDEAMQRLEALYGACGRDSFLEARENDVRVQVLAPAAECEQRDYLVQWDENGGHDIDLGGGRVICLRPGRYGEPCILGQTNDGTDAEPRWGEYLYPLRPHVPRIIIRGEGKERRIRYAITRLGGEKG